MIGSKQKFKVFFTAAAGRFLFSLYEMTSFLKASSISKFYGFESPLSHMRFGDYTRDGQKYHSAAQVRR